VPQQQQQHLQQQHRTTSVPMLVRAVSLSGPPSSGGLCSCSYLLQGQQLSKLQLLRLQLTGSAPEQQERRGAGGGTELTVQQTPAAPSFLWDSLQEHDALHLTSLVGAGEGGRL